MAGSSRQAGLPTPHGVKAAECALAVGGLALGTGEFASMGILPDVAREMQVGIPAAGHMISAYALGVVIGAPALAVIFARSPRRWLLIGLMIVFALCNLASAAAMSMGFLDLARFASGLPHGTYFGVASLVAASLVPPGERARAVGRVMLGLSIANVVGVPLATAFGNWFGWRASYGLVAALGLLTAVLIRLFVHEQPASEGASPMRELSGLKRLQLWLTLLTAGVGFGGLFAVYSYISPLLTQVTGVSTRSVPLFLSVTGLGMVAGSLFGGWLADRGVMRAIGIMLLGSAAVLLGFLFSSYSVPAILLNLFLMGGGIAIVPALQTRLMDVAADSQALAASLNHSAFNMANALGAWLGGVAIAQGHGWTSTAVVGAMLGMGGFLIFLLSLATSRTRGTEAPIYG
ncbi:MFS transporter [Sphingobium sp. 22B]|uniref:MFS transporter n=1 Tax=unclassified Sphingobium TaxID=2611147 RepID=UPI000786064C|nr:MULTISPECIES: MFS transporter [unclassified Sphingobium]KXU29432.1 MFS transporter [Sphingobium sp. AM]KYC30859.1 MFS transporter [Sphingobium sp. 22B]OAP29392.1 MFS transporter [Sphingobium sp. 20006FA]